jgi:2-polyprenyl-3-methyl-5-hydroxy-6-metoxy-1,4-benzoquinol methylase
MNILQQERWWETFFSGVALDVWRQLRTDQNTKPEADFIERAVPLSPGAHVLDVPCGNGRLCFEMVARGYRATGVDLSQEFLEEARQIAEEKKVDVGLECRDMRDLPWENEFDVACCLGISFGYLDEQGNRDFVKAVCRALKPGGSLIVDTNKILEIVLPSLEKRRWAQLQDITLLLENRYNMAESRLDTEYTFLRNGQKDTRFTSQRAYSYRELCAMMQEAGFSKCVGYGSLKMEPLQIGSNRLLLVATK